VNFRAAERRRHPGRHHQPARDELQFVRRVAGLTLFKVPEQTFGVIRGHAPVILSAGRVGVRERKNL